MRHEWGGDERRESGHQAALESRLQAAPRVRARARTGIAGGPSRVAPFGGDALLGGAGSRASAHVRRGRQEWPGPNKQFGSPTSRQPQNGAGAAAGVGWALQSNDWRQESHSIK